jgi:hypothetical protein
MTHTDKEALKLALDWYDSGHEDREEFQAMIENLLAAPVQPVAWAQAAQGVPETDFGNMAQPAAWETEMRAELAKLGFDGQCPESIGITLKGWFDAYAKSLAAPAQPAPVHGPSGDYLSDFQEGQWWLAELDAVVANGTHDQKRAVAVVRNLLATVAANTTPPAAQPPAQEFVCSTGLCHYKALPDAIHHTDLSEHPEYISGWNDYRAAMMEMMK